MSTFTSAMDSANQGAGALVLDEKGALSLGANAVDSRVALFFKLVRNIPKGSLASLTEMAMKQSEIDTAVLAIQTRDIREGKGERKLFRWLFWELARENVALGIALINLLPHYGSYKDICALHRDLEAYGTKSAKALQTHIRCKLLGDALRDQAIADSEEKAALSLVGKWLPRECSKKGKALARKLALEMGGVSDTLVGDELRNAACASFKKYRKMVSSLNKTLGVVETKMCKRRFREVDPGKVPAGSLKKHRRAFFNSKGLEDADRVECAEAFKAHMAKAVKGEAKVHGRTLFAHDLVKEYFPVRYGDVPMDDDVLEAQWRDLREKFSELAKDGESPLGRYVALSDVSGSMSGTPMQVSVALGILISELTHPAFKDRFLTFETHPQWHDLSSCSSLKDKVNSTLQSPWGGSTDFERALDKILQACVAARVPEEEMPEALVVISDMQFDQARNRKRSWDTKYGKIRKKWREAGYSKVPGIVFWNVRGDTKDFPVESNQKGVSMISGFSQNLLKQFMSGELLSMSPLDMLRKILDDERYDKARSAIADARSIDEATVEEMAAATDRLGEIYCSVVAELKKAK